MASPEPASPADGDKPRPDTTVFETNELLEHILRSLDSPAEILRLSTLNRHAYGLIHESSGNGLKARTFLAPIPDAKEKWKVYRLPERREVEVVPADAQLLDEDEQVDQTTHLPLPRPIFQKPVMLNPLLVKDKYYHDRDLYGRLQLQTDAIDFVPALQTLRANMHGIRTGSDQYNWTCYKAMLCQPPTKQVVIDWRKPAEEEDVPPAEGGLRLTVNTGVSLRDLLGLYNQMIGEGLEIMEIRIPNVFFVTAQEWEWVLGNFKHPSSSTRPPQTPERGTERGAAWLRLPAVEKKIRLDRWVFTSPHIVDNIVRHWEFKTQLHLRATSKLFNESALRANLDFHEFLLARQKRPTKTAPPRGRQAWENLPERPSPRPPRGTSSLKKFRKNAAKKAAKKAGNPYESDDDDYSNDQESRPPYREDVILDEATPSLESLLPGKVQEMKYFLGQRIVIRVARQVWEALDSRGWVSLPKGTPRSYERPQKHVSKALVMARAKETSGTYAGCVQVYSELENKGKLLSDPEWRREENIRYGGQPAEFEWLNDAQQASTSKSD